MAREAAMLPLSMIAVQAIMVGMLLLSKLALNGGMAPLVLTVYRNLAAAVVVAPLGLLLERELLKKINWTVLAWISANATFGVGLAMGLYYYGLQKTNAAYSAIYLNLVPIVTFILAVILRTETLSLAKWSGRSKFFGAVLCVTGTLLVSLLKGPVLHVWPTGLLLKGSHARAPASPTGAHLVAGTLFLCGSCVAYSLWLLIQARLATVFPSKYWTTVFTCLIGSSECLVVGVCLSHDKADWTLKWDLQLLAVIYSGVLNTGVMFVVIAWVITKRGPIYAPMFNSLFLIFSTVLDSVLLGTNIYLGTVLGTVLTVVGLYGYLWGKDKELKLAAAARAQKQAEETAQREQQDHETV